VIFFFPNDFNRRTGDDSFLRIHSFFFDMEAGTLLSPNTQSFFELIGELFPDGFHDKQELT